MAHELLLKGGHVVTMDDSLGELSDADGVIAAVGHGLSTSIRDADVIDATGRPVIPKDLLRTSDFSSELNG